MLCASIKEKTMNGVLKRLPAVPKDYDLVEIWVNEVRKIDVDKILKTAKNPLLFKITDSNDELIEEILDKNIAYIDIDINTKSSVLEKILNKKGKTKLIISFHDFKGTPVYSKLLDLAKKMKKYGADIGKIVVTAKKFKDNTTSLKLLNEGKKLHLPLISFCMGSEGRMSRIYASHYGSVIDFVPPDDSWKTADGQLTLDEWKKLTSLV
jgi:3-dehydroquinate dehydratase type I